MNIFSFTGNLGKDCRTGDVNGTAVCNFTVAVKSGFGDREQTLWVDCALWGRQAASTLPNYLLKGQQVAVSGELGTKEHEGKTYMTLNVNSVDLVGGKSDSKPSQAAPQQAAPKTEAPKPADDFSSDIPF